MMNAQDTTGPDRGTVLLLAADSVLSDALGPALAGHGLALEVVQTPADLSLRVQAAAQDPAQRPAPTEARPAAVSPCTLLAVIDLRAFPDAESIGSIAAAAGPGLRLALACLGPADDLPQRLAALRAGAAAWLPANLEAADLAGRLAALLGPADGAPERVLVVDDQPVSALFAVRVLERAGMRVEQVADPLLVLATMDRFVPDLVLMDLHMPGVSGIELTAVIREQVRFVDLPIVFLSVELDPERQLEALRVGGDDFLAKPVPPERLLTCVRRRLAAARMRQRDGVRGHAGAPDALVGRREPLLARLDRLIAAPAGADWALVYLEQPGDTAAVGRLAAAVAARAGLDAQVSRVSNHGVGMLLRGGPERLFEPAAEALARVVRADLQAGAGSVEVPAFGVGWCAVTAGGGESVTLLSRARKAARISLQTNQGRAGGYGTAPALPDVGVAKDPVLAAVAAGRFQLLFQPMVPLSTAVVERYEATLRLVGPQGELLAPSEFVPAARRAGQAVAIDRWLLTAGLDALGERRAAGQSVDLFLHQSIVSAADRAWVEVIRNEISARDLIQCRPVIQWQLSDVQRNLDLAARRAEELNRLRIRLCLNGFIASDESERVLERLPIAYIRLSRQVIRLGSPDWLQYLVGRLHDRKALVIATGIEGPESITSLCRAGIDLIQGPYVQAPAEGMDFDFADAVG